MNVDQNDDYDDKNERMYEGGKENILRRKIYFIITKLFRHV